MNALIEKLKEYAELPAIIWNDRFYSYNELFVKCNEALEFIQQNGVNEGEVVSLIGDFTPNTIALMFALIQNNNIIVPFNSTIKHSEQVKLDIACVQKTLLVDVTNDNYSIEGRDNLGEHLLYDTIRERKKAGLVLFTSGTSGNPKGAVHDFSRLLAKFNIARKSMSTVNFLLFDHWGGLNTMFHTLSNGGTVLTLRDRKPDSICAFIEKHKIELLPASPTFLNLMLMSEANKSYDLSSLKLITYGTEPMPLSTLERLKKAFPEVKLQQTYGLIELGVMRSKSESDNSLWVKVGGEGFDTRVVDSLLEIKADSAMLGYLNAPSPFTEDGWFMTGDEVEVKGEYIRILGRKSEIINVGGEKVYPQEVENIIQELDNIAEVTVFGQKNPIMGNIVCAKIRLASDEEKKVFVTRLKIHCKEKLQSFKIPVKIIIEDEPQFSERYKKKRQ
ncbi:long-chain fatty acid--CoA ligase [Flavobacterium yafengii]|uniref:Long-chain fatty acid--CoA ligase n=1 Tax=Flavobacterium yafengii TaxID=3041253 RepID=A0AAW6TMR3_9FLAO|nr:long-chain fatty acid--CoA ligase [Flavobacterium yafengii]MDI5950749.1 long-chain fatty acid--CoA ligase [Flavobacterium yafengii]